MQNINSPPELYCRHYSISIEGVSQRKFKNTRVDSFEWLGVLRHPTELDQLQLGAVQFLCPFRKTLNIPFRAQPHQGSQQQLFQAIHACYLSYIVNLLYNQDRSYHACQATQRYQNGYLETAELIGHAPPLPIAFAHIYYLHPVTGIAKIPRDSNPDEADSFGLVCIGGESYIAPKAEFLKTLGQAE